MSSLRLKGARGSVTSPSSTPTLTWGSQSLRGRSTHKGSGHLAGETGNDASFQAGDNLGSPGGCILLPLAEDHSWAPGPWAITWPHTWHAVSICSSHSRGPVCGVPESLTGVAHWPHSLSSPRWQEGLTAPWSRAATCKKAQAWV